MKPMASGSQPESARGAVWRISAEQTFGATAIDSAACTCRSTTAHPWPVQRLAIAGMRTERTITASKVWSSKPADRKLIG